MKKLTRLAPIETFGSRLRAERDSFGLTQEQFAGIGGVGKRSQIGYEQGRTYPTAEYLMRLHEVGVDVTFVLTGKRSSEG